MRTGARIVRVSRMVGDLARAVAFYTDGLGFVAACGPEEVPEAGLLGLSGARRVRLRLGAEEVALVACTPGGVAYPADSRSNDLWFQHLAVVVDDMDAAMQVLTRQRVVPISRGGAQVLPARNGGVEAFKFRDPDGHPLELLHFPAGQGRAVWHGGAAGPFLGMDHTAITVRSGRQSLRFYGRLGFRVATRSFNFGPAQGRLDGLAGAAVHVTGLRLPGAAGAGLELLRYMPPGRPRPAVGADAMLTDWVTVAVPGAERPEVAADPDGHLLVMEAAADAPALPTLWKEQEEAAVGGVRFSGAEPRRRRRDR